MDSWLSNLWDGVCNAFGGHRPHMEDLEVVAWRRAWRCGACSAVAVDDVRALLVAGSCPAMCSRCGTEGGFVVGKSRGRLVTPWLGHMIGYGTTRYVPDEFVAAGSRPGPPTREG